VETVLFFTDPQLPFEHKDALDFCVALKETYKPTVVVCGGDEVDQHALGQWEHDPDGYSSGHEADLVIERIELWYKAFPRTKVCTSNHTDRIFRKAFKHGIPKRYIRDYKEFLNAPIGWTWKDFWIIDDVRYEHGHHLGSGSGSNATKQIPALNMQSTAFGHFHSFAGIQYLHNEARGILFGLNGGCLIDPDRYAFKYAYHNKKKAILGASIIKKGIPHFFPLIQDRYKRWVGKL